MQNNPQIIPIYEGEDACQQCLGWKRVANTDDQESWMYWAELPTQAALAIQLGLVKPIECPRCHGSGIEPQDQLLMAQKKAIELQEQLDEFEKFHPRAIKLLRKRKNFIVIADDEPYFMQAYELIRKQEIQTGTWSDDDQQAFEDAAQHLRNP